MSLFLSRVVRFALRKIAFEPRTRGVVIKAARGLADEARLIAEDKDRARAAGRSLRRAIDKAQGGRQGS